MVQPVDYYDYPEPTIVWQILKYVKQYGLHICEIDQGFIVTKDVLNIINYTDSQLGRILGYPNIPGEGIPPISEKRCSLHLWVDKVSIISFICRIEQKVDGVNLCVKYKNILEVQFPDYKFKVEAIPIYNLDFIFDQYQQGNFDQKYVEEFKNECYNHGIDEKYVQEILENDRRNIMIILVSYFIHTPISVLDLPNTYPLDKESCHKCDIKINRWVKKMLGTSIWSLFDRYGLCSL